MANGNVGRAIRRRNRYKNDLEFREKRRLIKKSYRERNKEKERIRRRNWEKQLNEYVNKHCLVCNKLLNWRTEGKYCIDCWRIKKWMK